MFLPPFGIALYGILFTHVNYIITDKEIVVKEKVIIYAEKENYA